VAHDNAGPQDAPPKAPRRVDEAFSVHLALLVVVVGRDGLDGFFADDSRRLACNVGGADVVECLDVEPPGERQRLTGALDVGRADLVLVAVLVAEGRRGMPELDARGGELLAHPALLLQHVARNDAAAAERSAHLRPATVGAGGVGERRVKALPRGAVARPDDRDDRVVGAPEQLDDQRQAYEARCARDDVRPRPGGLRPRAYMRHHLLQTLGCI
jgi:hypothetical protein